MECFCLPCEKLVCEDCMFQSHGEHGTEDVSTNARKSRTIIAEYLQKTKDSRTNDNILDRIRYAKSVIETSRDTYLHEIENIKLTCDNLEANLVQLISKTQVSASEEIDRINQNLISLTGIREEQKTLISHTEIVLKEGTYKQVIKAGKNMPSPDTATKKIDVNKLVLHEDMGQIKDKIFHLSKSIVFGIKLASYHAWKEQLTQHSSFEVSHPLRGATFDLKRMK